MPENDLLEEFAKTTTTEEEVSSLVPDDVEIEETLDFEAAENYVPEEDDEAVGADWDQEEEFQVESLDSDFSAEILISGIDSLNRAILPRIATSKFRKKLSDSEKITLAKAKIKLDDSGSESEFNQEEKRLLAKFSELERKLEAIPFRDDEVEGLKKPLAIYLEKKGVSMPPEIALVMKSLEVIGGRIVDVLVD